MFVAARVGDCGGCHPQIANRRPLNCTIETPVCKLKEEAKHRKLGGTQLQTTWGCLVALTVSNRRSINKKRTLTISASKKACPINTSKLQFHHQKTGKPNNTTLHRDNTFNQMVIPKWVSFHHHTPIIIYIQQWYLSLVSPLSHGIYMYLSILSISMVPPKIAISPD